jgi:methyl-accepting chemotaxis protein
VVKEKITEVKLENVPVSELSVSGQTWSSDDRQFFKRALEYNNEKVKKYIKKHITDEVNRIKNELAEALLTRDRKMFDKMDEQTELMKSFRVELSHLREDVTGIRQQAKIMSDKYEDLYITVQRIDHRTKKPIIYLRLVITAIVTAIALYFAIKYAHDHWWVAYISNL